MIFHIQPIFHKEVLVAETERKIGFELIVLGYVVKPAITIITPKGHIHK